MASRRPYVENLLPIAYGNEEETSFTVSKDGSPFANADMADIYAAVPPRLQTHPRDVIPRKEFLSNGSLIYNAGHLELCTPECSSTGQVTQYMRATEQILVNLGIHYTEREAGRPGVGKSKVRIQRRVIDSDEHRWGVHDNFGLEGKAKEWFQSNPDAVDTFVGHLAARSVVTGAGYVAPWGLHYSQKIGGLVDVTGYGLQGYFYRFDDLNGQDRWEVRTTDINLSDWADDVRFGSAAYVGAIAQSPLREYAPSASHEEAVAVAKSMNWLELNHDGTIQSTQPIRKALDDEQRYADLAMHKLGEHTAYVPKDILETAEEVYTFCDDMKRILGGQATIELVADRADWAAKFLGIQAKIKKDQGKGIPRTLSDGTSRAHDLAYDIIRVESENGRPAQVNYGWGYKLRDEKKIFRQTVPKGAVQQAYLHPPTTTRAGIRTAVIKDYICDDTNWQSVIVRTNSGKYETVQFPDVGQTKLNKQQLDILARSQKRKID